VRLLLEKGGAGAERIFDNHTLDLAFYEAGNAFWKATLLRERISTQEAKMAVEFLDELKEQVEVEALESLNLRRVMEVALRERITFYDASYIVSAEVRELPLVTEDRDLAETASRYVAVESAID